MRVLINCIRNIRFYGLRWAFANFYMKFLNVIRPYPSHTELKFIHDRTYAHKICIRRGTSDWINYLQIFKSPEMSPCDRLRNVKTIVDIGAYIGCTALYFLSKFPEAKIFCLEPDNASFDLLQINTSAHAERTHLIKAAAWNSDTTIRALPLKRPRFKWSAKFTEECAHEDLPGVKTVSIPSFLKVSGAPFIDLLKIDIEGGEFILFEKNCCDWISRIKNLMIEFHDLRKSQPVIEKLRNSFRYSFQYGEHYFFFDNKNSQNYF